MSDASDPRSLLQRLNLRWRGRARAPLILQTEAAECALACLAMIAGAHGQRYSLAELRAAMGKGGKPAKAGKRAKAAPAEGGKTRKKAAIKFRDSSGNTWTGRGRAPRCAPTGGE